jgi:hypothetical protein
VDLNAFNGKQLALWLTDDADESVIFRGTLRWDGSTLNLDRIAKAVLEVRPEWHDRIKPVPDEEEVRKILLDCDYYLHLRVGTLSDSADESEYEGTGIKWPE